LTIHISTIDRAVLAGTIALGLAFAASQASAWPATAEACNDGDTRTVISDSGQRVTIRLHGVDAPELDQPNGAQARLLINSLVDGQRVEVKPTGDLSYGRTAADIMLPSGRDVGTTLVASGAAWVEQRWNHDPAAYAAQGNAQRAHLGLWADAAAVPPWLWRAEHAHATFSHPAVGRSTSDGHTPALVGAAHNKPTAAPRRQGQPT
jgi:endonuclease YncB( thermonuclease family)